MPGYIPTRDVDLLAWADNFSAVLAAAPATYALVGGDITLISNLVTAFDTAYALAVNPATRTPATVAGKDSARGAMVPILREYAQLIKANTGISNADKVAAGIHIDDAVPTPVPPPTSVPRLAMNAAFHLTQQLDIRAIETPTSRAKPPGSIALLLFGTKSLLADPVPTDPTVAPFAVLATRNLQTISFASGDVGKRMTYWGRWVNRRGEVGPWSNPLSQVIA